MCQKFETQFSRSMCEEMDAMLIIFSDLHLADVYLDLWVREAFVNIFTFLKNVSFFPF